MRARRIAACIVLTATAAFAQSGAQRSFDQLKSLAGSWEGKNSMGQPVQVSYRMTAGGSALMSEIVGHGETMISMINFDGPNRLLLVSGVFIGALMTVGLLAVAFGQADRSIGHEHELREFDLPVLGTISIYQSASAFRLYAQAAGITAATLLLVAIYGGILVNGGLLVSSARMVL